MSRPSTDKALEFAVHFLITAARDALSGRPDRDPVLAERRCREALALLVPGVGETHPWTAAAWDMLAWALDEQARDDEAESCYLRSLSVQQAAGWPEAVSADLTGLRLAALYERMDKPGLHVAVSGWLRARQERPIDRAPVPPKPPPGPPTVCVRSFRVIAPLGIEHVAAESLVQICGRFVAMCWVSAGGTVVDARSLPALITQSAAAGDVMTVVAEGDDAEELMKAIGMHWALSGTPRS